MALTLRTGIDPFPMSQNPWEEAQNLCINTSQHFSGQVFICSPDSQLCKTAAADFLCDGNSSSNVQWPHIDLHIWGIPVIYSREAIKIKDVSRVPTWFEPKQPFDLW